MPRTTVTAKKSTGAPAPHRNIAKSSGDRSCFPEANPERSTPPWPAAKKASQTARAKKKQRLDDLPNAARADSTLDLPRADAVTAAEGHDANSPCDGDNVRVWQQDGVKPCSDRINPSSARSAATVEA
jgi:hypothetical protein